MLEENKYVAICKWTPNLKERLLDITKEEFDKVFTNLKVVVETLSVEDQIDVLLYIIDEVYIFQEIDDETVNKNVISFLASMRTTEAYKKMKNLKI